MGPNLRPISAREFAGHDELPEWRYLLGRIEATFAAPSFASAAAFVGRIADAADAADHHPDVELRYPGRVHVALTTHAVDGLTVADVELATTISGLASTAGLTLPAGVDGWSVRLARRNAPSIGPVRPPRTLPNRPLDLALGASPIVRFSG